MNLFEYYVCFMSSDDADRLIELSGLIQIPTIEEASKAIVESNQLSRCPADKFTVAALIVRETSMEAHSEHFQDEDIESGVLYILEATECKKSVNFRKFQETKIGEHFSESVCSSPAIS